MSSFYSTIGTLAAQIAAITDPSPSAVYFNTGNLAPGFVEIQLPGLYTVNIICLQVAQSPNGNTLHQIYVGTTTNPSTLATTLSGYTSSGQWINLTYSPPLTNVRFLRVNTVTSPSWVAWVKFLVY